MANIKYVVELSRTDYTKIVKLLEYAIKTKKTMGYSVTTINSDIKIIDKFKNNLSICTK